MPKQRTHSGAKDRFRVTRNGKVLHTRMNMNHLLEGKPSTRKRRLSQVGQVDEGNAAHVKRLLGRR
jgi:large subunit ribosomal protein L35